MNTEPTAANRRHKRFHSVSDKESRLKPRFFVNTDKGEGQGLSVVKEVSASEPMIHPHPNPNLSGQGLRRMRMSDQEAVYKTERPWWEGGVRMTSARVLRFSAYRSHWAAGVYSVCVVPHKADGGASSPPSAHTLECCGSNVRI